MKKLVVLFVLACAGINMQGQVSEVTRFMSMGEHNAYFISIPGADAEIASSVWQKYAKQFKGKLRQDKKTKEYLLDDAQIPELSTNSVDVYYRVGESSVSVTDVYVWFNLGGVFLNSQERPESGKTASTLISQYGRLVQKAVAEKVLSSEEDVLKALQKDLNKLDKEKQGYQKKIEDALALIAKMEGQIEINDEARKAKNGEISQQLERIDTAKSSVQSFN